MMALAGLQVPADDADIPLLDGIYADIGDQQSIIESLSTFSSHIRNLRQIMDAATASSLILIDELGSSTDPEEGSALAAALLSEFRDRNVMVVATTHHRNVARLAQDQAGMINASVDLNPRTLEPTYQLTHGVPGRSYALTIAARLGLPESVIAGAQRTCRRSTSKPTACCRNCRKSGLRCRSCASRLSKPWPRRASGNRKRRSGWKRWRRPRRNWSKKHAGN